MKLIILTTGYPEEGDFYRNGFIHQRVLQYIKNGHECTVLVYNRKKEEFREYIFEGVNVLEGGYSIINSYLNSSNFDRVLVHFINKYIIDLINDIEKDVPIIVWIHGIEALSWKRRLFNLSDITFVKYILSNIFHLYYLRRFIISNTNVKYVFVSNWMKNVMEQDLKIKIKNYKIIPNVINTDLFSYDEKDKDLRKKILIIRNFSSRKYANDISIKALLKLSKKSYFNDLSISIYGKGKYFNKLTKPLQRYKNIEIHEKFLSQKDIALKHKDYGIFLCPTRQDAQGVSMCEAMSSGLVPITSNNTAIPEFASASDGYLTNNSPESIVNSIEELYFNPDIFLTKSKNSSVSINQKCNSNIVIAGELIFIIQI